MKLRTKVFILHYLFFILFFNRCYCFPLNWGVPHRLKQSDSTWNTYFGSHSVNIKIIEKVKKYNIHKYHGKSKLASSIAKEIPTGSTVEKDPSKANSSDVVMPKVENRTSNMSGANPFAILDKILYPSIPSPYHTSTLAVSSLHNISYYLYGNEDGEPALFLHGGPGAGCFPNHARFFNPSHYRIVLFDQRGCGKSKPRGEIRNNTFMDLVQDCETLRKHLNVKKWKVVLGGSWGTTLAIAYAQEYPTCVGGLILRGVCLFRTTEIDWLFGDHGGASKLNPDAWKHYADFVLNSDDKNQAVDTNHEESNQGRTILHSYYNRLLSSDPHVRLNAAKYWSGWERNMSFVMNLAQNNSTKTADNNMPHMIVYDGTSWTYHDEFDEKLNKNVLFNSEFLDAKSFSESLRKLPIPTEKMEEESTYLRSMREIDMVKKRSEAFQYPMHEPGKQSLPIPVQNMLTCFYSVNNSPTNEVFGVDLLDKMRMSKIRSIPCIAIHGGLDCICPLDNVLDFAKNHVQPQNLLVKIPVKAGHSMYNPDIATEIIRATDWFSSTQGE